MFPPASPSPMTLPRSSATAAPLPDSADAGHWIGNHWRIDPGHNGNPEATNQPVTASPSAASAVATQQQASSFAAPDPALSNGTTDPVALAIAHAENLIHRVQRLSEDLDARSAKLNADIAAQERRERAFRIWAQQRSEELLQQQAACAVERQTLQQQARRWVFGGS